MTRFKTPTGWRQPVGYFTSVAEDLNSGLPRTNPASGQSGTQTRDRRIARPTRRLLGHAACPSYQLNVIADEVRVIRTKYR